MSDWEGPKKDRMLSRRKARQDKRQKQEVIFEVEEDTEWPHRERDAGNST